MSTQWSEGDGERQEPPEAQGLRAALRALGASAGDGGPTLLTTVRTRVRRRRAAKAAATGLTACVLVGAVVAGVAQADARPPAPVAPAVTDRPSPTRPATPTPMVTPTVTPTQPPTPSSTPTSTAGAGDVVTARFDDGFVPKTYTVQDVALWDGWPYEPAHDARYFTCGSPESLLQAAATGGGGTLGVTDPQRTTPGAGLDGTSYDAVGAGLRLTYPTVGRDDADEAAVVLVQGGRVVGLLDRGIVSGYTWRGGPGALTGEWTTPPGFVSKNLCLQDSWTDTGDPAAPWSVADDAPLQAAGAYRAYVVVQTRCQDGTCRHDGSAGAAGVTLVSAPFELRVRQDGTLAADGSENGVTATDDAGFAPAG